MATQYVTVIVNDKRFFMESLPTKTVLENTPFVISIVSLHPSKILAKSKLHGILSLKLRTDLPSEADFGSVFSANAYFFDDRTTMCATLSGESEITFYGAVSPHAVVVGAVQQPLMPPPYPWHWKFHFQESCVVPNDETDLQWNNMMTKWARSVVSARMESLNSPNGNLKACDYFDVQPSRITPCGGANFRVYLPPGTKECWDTVHEKKEQTRWIVSGSPGIGKTVTTIYYLRLLMEENTTVILYNTRKEVALGNQWYLFALHDDGYHCFTLKDSCNVFSVGFWVKIPECAHIVDLDQNDAHLSGNDARTVLVTTPDGTKIGDYKKEGVLFSWVPAPRKSVARSIAYDIVERSSTTQTELARKKLEIEKRMHQVGPILRRLLDKTEYETAVTAIKDSFKEGACVDTTNAIMSPNLQDLSQGKKPHSYLLMITKRDYLGQNVEYQDNDDNWADNGADDTTRKTIEDDAPGQNDLKVEGWSADKSGDSHGVHVQEGNVPRFVVVPVCREAVALAFNDSMAQSAGHFLSRTFPHLRNLQGGAGFEDWIILAACQGILNGKAYPLQGKGPVANDAVARDVIFADGQEHKEGKKNTRSESISAWLQLEKGSSVAGIGNGLIQPNKGFPLLDFMDRKDRGGQITLAKKHSVVVGILGNHKKDFGWTKQNPLHALYIVSELDFSKFQLEREPPEWVKAYVVNAGDLSVNVPEAKQS